MLCEEGWKSDAPLLVCLDAKEGKQLWVADLEGKQLIGFPASADQIHNHMASPVLAGGKLIGFGQPGRREQPWTRRGFYINDTTSIKDGKLLVHDGTCYPWATGGKKPEQSVEAEHVICDLANPKDIIINEETIAPPGIR